MTKKANRPGRSMEVHYESVLEDISSVIDAARNSAARSVLPTRTSSRHRLENPIALTHQAVRRISRRRLEQESCRVFHQFNP